jgi:hypothetical protein
VGEGTMDVVLCKRSSDDICTVDELKSQESQSQMLDTRGVATIPESYNGGTMSGIDSL